MTVPCDDLSPEALQALLVEIEPLLPQAPFAKIKTLVDRILKLRTGLEQKKISIYKLRQLVFGAKTEKLASMKKPGEETSSAQKKTPAVRKPKQPAPGHGRRSAEAFPGAVRCLILHTDYEARQRCPFCLDGKLYRLAPSRHLHFVGQAPIALTIYEFEKLRCNLCGEIFTASYPSGDLPPKYAPSAIAIIGLLKYGQGLPWYRLGQLQSALGVPLAPSTQWEVVNKHAMAPAAVYQALIVMAAQAPLLHNDDTTMRILDLQRPSGDTRTGIFTTAILACSDTAQIALFFTGTAHAGENLTKVLEHRQIDLPPPMQMCDALGRNVSSTFKTILGNCLTHGRRKFVDVFAQFPEDCQFVLETFATIYHHDDHCKEAQLSDTQRLLYHQTHSQPRMEALHRWMQTQIDEHRIEPHSGLGQAITYMRKHWEKLTLFLRVAGAPLDNNCCERILKRAILHRKNALFYKTQTGACIGDIFMSLIHTCQLNGINPFDYLTVLIEQVSHVLADPFAWLPWNYQDNFEPTG